MLHILGPCSDGWSPRHPHGCDGDCPGSPGRCQEGSPGSCRLFSGSRPCPPVLHPHLGQCSRSRAAAVLVKTEWGAQRHSPFKKMSLVDSRRTLQVSLSAAQMTHDFLASAELPRGQMETRPMQGSNPGTGVPPPLGPGGWSAQGWGRAEAGGHPSRPVSPAVATGQINRWSPGRKQIHLHNDEAVPVTQT